MASPLMFPGAGGTFGGAASPLAGPPPSPTPMGGADPAGAFSMKGIAGPGAIPSSSMPPEILTGITQSAQAMNDMLDAWAQVAPNRGPQLALIKDMLQQFLADLMADGAGPTAPTATGPAFPGGGMDRGLAGAGAI